MATQKWLPRPYEHICLALLLALIPLFVPFGRFAPTASAQGSCTSTTLDWDPIHWIQNGATTVAGGSTYASQNILRQTLAPPAPTGQRPVSMDFQIRGATDDFNASLPNDTSALTPGGGESLEFDFTFDDDSETITLIITFDTDVTGVTFTVYDVDRVNDANDDRLVISGLDSTNTALPATIINGANNALTSSAGNSYTIDGAGTNGNGVSSAGNVSVNFDTAPIRTITLVFGNNPTGATVAAQEMAVGDFKFCAPVTATCITSVGELNWGAGTILSPGNAEWLPAGSLNQAFTIPGTGNGAALGFTFTVTGNVLHLAQGTPATNTTLTGGYLPFDNQSLLLVADPPSASSVLTVTIDLSIATRDVYFQIFDADVSNDDTSPNAPNTADNDRRDVVTVVGYNTGVNQTVLPAMLGVSSGALQDNILIGNTFSGVNGGSDTSTQGAPSTSNEANMDIRFAEPVNRITIRYEEGGGASNPAARGIALSDIQFCRPPALAVTLNYFEALCRADDILVAWETTSETDALGFNLYRSTEPTMMGERLNTELIPTASPGGGQGAYYEYADTSVAEGNTYYYTLESVDMYGMATQHPSVMASFPCQPTAITLSHLSASADPLLPFLALGVIALAGIVLYQRRTRP
jgi:hypothetical protein